MNPFDGYQVPQGFFSEEGLYQNKRYQLFRAVNKANDQPVTLKKNRPDGGEILEVSKLSHEYNILKSLDHPGILKVSELISSGKMVTLVQEWFDGVTLKDRMAGNPLPLSSFFGIALQMAEILQYLHNAGIVHRDVNPSNILVSKDDKVKLIDFGISTSIHSAMSEAAAPELIEGTLVYMSPEQTGRTSYSVTSSCDLYSLGVVLYEMLAGKPPFDSTDALEIIHFHLSRKPEWLQKVHHTLPYGVCAVIQKLLEKSPDDRYQSAGGLLADLHVLYNDFINDVEKDHFVPAANDGLEKFKQTQKLYGREREEAQLLKCYDELGKTKSMLVLVSGYSGVGKSELVKQVQQPIVKKKGTFITGKFDQFKQNIPYFSFIEAFRELIKTILSESEEKINLWRHKITQVLGDNGGLITEVIPYLEKIIGKQPPVAKLQPAEQEYRFRMVMLDFIYAFTSPGQPMVIFLDDLQWSDLPSLNLIERILVTPGNGHILILGTYRDNEVSELHPLRVTIQQLHASYVHIKDIRLASLDVTTTTRITADSFGMTEAEAASLGALTHKKTNGNPFFINRFLKSLFDDGYISYNTRGKWEWDINAIESLGYTDNVIDLMTKELASLPINTRETMKWAAVLGNTFNLAHLSLVSAKPQHEVFAILSPALKAGYILPLDNHYRALSLSQEGMGSEWKEESSKLSSSFKFLHDKVQQAVYALISETERVRVHLHTGRILLANTREDKLTETIFEIVSHFTECLLLITDLHEKRQVSELFLLAGRKAKDSTSYDVAVRYLASAIKLSSPSSWDTDYNLMFDIYLELGECEYLNSDHEKAEHYFEDLLKYARSDLEKLKIYYVQSSMYIKLSNVVACLNTGRTAMKLFNIRFPEHPLAIKLATAREMLKYLFLFSTKYKNPEKLYHLKQCDDPKIIAINQFLIDMSTSAYQVNQELMMLVIFRIIRQYIRYGFTDASGWGFSGFSVVTLSALGLSKKGFNLWDITTKLHQRTNSQIIKWRLDYTVRAFGVHWRRPLAENLDGILDNIKACMMNGDPIFTGYCISLFVWKKSATGYPIRALLNDTNDHIEYLKRNKNTSGLDFTVTRLQVARALAGMTTNFSDLDDEHYSASQAFASIKASGNNTTIGFFYCARIIQLFYFGKYREVVDCATEGKDYQQYLLGHYMNAEWIFYHCLSIASCYAKVSSAEKRSLLKDYEKGMKWMKIWAHDCPENFECMYKILSAEHPGKDIEFEVRLRLYEDAGQKAMENGFVQQEAIANQRAANYLILHGYEKLSRQYLQNAWDLLHTWGATAVCKDLENKYPNLLAHGKTEFGLHNTGHHAHTTTSGTTTVVLDLGTVLKASQSLASEVKLGDLLQKLMHIVIENAGAEKGYLLLERNGVLCIEAEGNSGPRGNRTIDSVPFEGSDMLPESIVQYCWRIEEAVVVSNAMKDDKYYNDSFVTGHKVLSMLCMPITEKGIKIGLLYLENCLLEGVFTANRLELLTMLSGQIGISIQNAMLYENLEEKVRERTLEIKKQQVQIEEEMRKSDLLLLNILPAKTASDLKANGFSKAISYPNAHVMFCDIEGFTSRAEGMGPDVLVDEIHELFSGMDDIMGRYRIEKIKTIGDAYMCAAGLSETEDADAVIRMIHSAKEILVFLEKLNKKKAYQSKTPLRLRIGINSGPVIAGVVGTRKFAYDIWGDTVNTASRMESAGEAGKINVSYQTYVQIKDVFTCTARGKLQAKNKGLIDMFFVE